MLARETNLDNENTANQIISEQMTEIGEIAKIAPAAVATPFPPLKFRKMVHT